MTTLRLLLRKELKLALHPTAPLFLGLSAMLMIPSYPYLVVFFYTGLALFFTCLNGRENGDVSFTLLLPVGKRDVVRGRMLTAVLLELCQILTAVPFAILRNTLMRTPNAAGMDANIALFGFAFALLGLFNLVFFRLYYRDVRKVGRAFLWASAAVFLFITAEEACAHVVPFLRDVLDTPDPANFLPKALMLFIGLLLWVLLTATAYTGAVRDFEKQDL